MNGIFLINYAVKGIKNIDELVSLSFYKKTIDKKFNPKGYNLKGIYGANGAGKTGIIASVRILRRLLLEQNYLSNTIVQNELHELINRKTGELEIYAEFLSSTIQTMYLFDYEVKLIRNDNDQFEIEHESLIRQKVLSHVSLPEACFETNEGNLSINCDDEYSHKLADMTKNLLSNASVTSIVLNKEELLNLKYSNGSDMWTNVISLALFGQNLFVCTDHGDDHSSYHVSQYLDSGEMVKPNDFDLFFKQLKTLKGRNTGGLSAELIMVEKNSYRYFEKRVNKLYEFLRVFKDDLKEIDIDKKDNGNSYNCSLIMNYGDYSVNAEFESTGIKKLIRLFDYFDKMIHGKIVFIDELDSNLHDVYLCALLEYLMENGKGQLCFTTHNAGPMDVLKKNKKSIDFLSTDHTIHPWVTNGNYSPAKLYKKGMIEGSPFNIFPFEFAKAFYTEEDSK